MYKNEIFYILSEIIFCIIIIIFSYYIWDNFDLTQYNIAKYYDNTKEVEIVYESDADKGYLGNNVVLSVHNISNKLNNKNVIFKLSKNIILNDIMINNKLYNLNDIYISDDEFYNYFLIENINLDSYETKVYFIDLIDNNIYDYEFITEI